MENKNIIKIVISLFMLIIGISQIAYSANYDYAALTETLLNQNPDPVEPGNYVELRFKIEKIGNEELTDIKYELVPSYPFSFDNSDSPIKNLGNWVGNSDDKEFYILYYKLKVDEKALEDSYELKLLQTSSNNQNVKEYKFDVRVDEKKSPELIIGKTITTPLKLIANYDEALIKVEIVNIGDETAKQVIVDLNLPEGFEESFGYSTRANIGSIEAGQSKHAEFYIDTNEGLTKGNHKASLTILYKEDDADFNNQIKTITKDFDISIFGRPEYKIINHTINPIAAGKTGEIKLTIQNIGSGNSDSTSIQIFKDSSQPFTFEERSDFIGKVEVGQTGEVVFNLEVDPEATPKEYKLKLQIRSVVDGDVLIEDENIVLNIENPQKPTPADSVQMRILIYVIFALIGMYIGFKFAKNKYCKNKNKKEN